ncbi:hypothetical protein [Nonomuraea rubra]|uniref:hypothetical protein n=1 Tax=Nonomuraea rubra TaxID=46180 RepID=UPI0033E4F81A
MTSRHRLAAGLLLATASCGIASLLAETAAGRVVVVTVLVFVYAASVADLAAAVYAGAIAWVLLVAFFLRVDQITHAPTALAALMAAAAAGTVYGRCTRR